MTLLLEVAIIIGVFLGWLLAEYIRREYRARQIRHAKVQAWREQIAHQQDQDQWGTRRRG